LQQKHADRSSLSKFHFRHAQYTNSRLESQTASRSTLTENQRDTCRTLNGPFTPQVTMKFRIRSIMTAVSSTPFLTRSMPSLPTMSASRIIFGRRSFRSTTRC